MLGNIKHVGTVTNEAFEVIKNQVIKSIFIEIDDN